MSKAKATRAFRRHAAACLKAAGFVGPRGHFVRRDGAVTQIVELQHSVYGGRITANLGLDLEWLRPEIRWIPRPQLGPHAHDAIRWIRIGLAGPDRRDQWWSFQEDEETLEKAGRALAQAVMEHGIPWLEAQSGGRSFLRHAEERHRRSCSDAHPEGGFPEVRLLAAINAWVGDYGEARRFLELARPMWPQEKARLQAARRVYRDRQVEGAKLPRVPDLLKELERLTEPTKGGSVFQAPRRAPRSRSGRV
ncbi:MAG: DUF4304 domain-containing protein [Myxococcota bacterium]